MSSTKKESGVANVSGYLQQNTPIEEGKTTRKQGPSKGRALPEANVRADSAGGQIKEPALLDFTEKGQYGKIHIVGESHLGHLILYDETLGNERILVLNPNGSYTHFSPKEKVDKIEGTHYLLVNGDEKVEIRKDRLVYTHGNETVTISKNKTENVVGDHTQNVSGNSSQYFAGLTINTTGDVKVLSGGNAEVSASGEVSVNGSLIKLNSGEATPPEPAPPIADGVQPGVTMFAYATTVGEDTEGLLTPEEEAIYVAAGIDLTAVQETTTNIIMSDTTTTSPAGFDSTYISVCGIVPNPLDYEFQLSPNFKLKNLTTKCAISSYPIRAQLSLTEEEIFCNLKFLATNLLEPISSKFGKPTVNSGFRHGSNTSWHNKGCAADLQWAGLTDQQYYQRAIDIKNTFEWCEVILEWGGTRPWIHVAFNQAANNRTNFKTRTKCANIYQSGFHLLKNVPGVGGI